MTHGVQAIVRQLESGSREFFGVDAASVTLGSREARPFSDVWRARVIGPSKPLAIYIKLIKSPPGGPSLDTLRARLQKDFDISARIHREMRGDPHLATVRPIAYFAPLVAMVTEEFPGVNLLNVLERRARRWRPDRSTSPDEVFEHAGAWARRFQEIEGVATPRSFNELSDYIDVRLRRLAANALASFDDRDRQRVLAYLTRRRTEVDVDDLSDVAIHADFTPANAIADGARVAVLDFAMIKRGTRLHDIARFYAQMDLLKSKPQFDPAVITMLQHAVLRGYRSDLTPDRPIFQVLVLLHTVNHFESLVTRPARFPVSLYNRFVAARHLRWIRETARA
jgi:hypothetical protein